MVNREKRLIDLTAEKNLMSGVYKKVIKLNSNKINNLINRWANSRDI